MARNLLVEMLGGIPFGAASLIRGKRIFHPRGVAFSGQIDLDARGRPLAPQGSGRVTVRISNGAGVAGPLPDVRGFGLRIRDAHGRGRHQDLALATGARAVGLRNMLLPTSRVSSAFFSSILPYRFDGRLVVFGASADGPLEATSPDDLRDRVSEAPVTFELYAAALMGPWERLGRVRLVQALSPRQSSRIALNPWNTGDAVRPIGLLNALRDPAYRWSQMARRLRREPAEGDLTPVDSSSIERVPISS